MVPLGDLILVLSFSLFFCGGGQERRFLPFKWVMENGVWLSIDLAPAEGWKAGDEHVAMEGGKDLDSCFEAGF